MRQTELDRMNFLINKRDSGEQLNDKEHERLDSLLEKQAKENQKQEVKENGRREQQSDRSTNHPGGDDSQNGGGELRKGESPQHGNRNKTNRDNGGTDKRISNNGNRNDVSNDGSPRPIGDISGSSRAESGQSSRESRGDNRGANGGRGRGEQSGINSDSGSRSGSGNHGQESEAQRVVNLKPKDIKPKRKKAPGKKSTELDAETLSALIQSGFSLIANVSGRQHWEVSEEEADAVAEPLDKILDNLTAKQKKAIEKYSAPVMLAGAVAGIVIPRVMTDLYMIKKRKQGKGVVTNAGHERTIEANINGDITTDIKLGQNERHGGDSANVQSSSPVNDPIVTGLFAPSN